MAKCLNYSGKSYFNKNWVQLNMSCLPLDSLLNLNCTKDIYISLGNFIFPVTI